MIRIVLRGRTANILFQYALGRALAERKGVRLILDASWYNSEGWGEVSHFLRLPIKAKVLRPPLPLSLAARALRNHLGKHRWEFIGIPVFKELVHDQSFDPRIAEAAPDCMLSGFFQSPLYFESIARELRAELNSLLAGVERTPSGKNLGASLSKPGTVAVHVRRGDYLEIPVFQVCDLDYYRKAMDEMRNRIAGARFYVFSDDPEWCRSNFPAKDTEVIDSGKGAANPLHDLHLMSLASHHIIANSSYSWWAAWLGDKKGQEVIMPDRWFAHGIKAPMHEKRWK